MTMKTCKSFIILVIVKFTHLIHFFYSYLFLNQTDPDGAMTWLSNQLVDAEKAGDKVQILAHIPGGDGEMFQSWAMNYYRLVNRQV